jgi:hypothetical protein
MDRSRAAAGRWRPPALPRYDPIPPALTCHCRFPGDTRTAPRIFSSDGPLRWCQPPPRAGCWSIGAFFVLQYPSAFRRGRHPRPRARPQRWARKMLAGRSEATQSASRATADSMRASRVAKCHEPTLVGDCRPLWKSLKADVTGATLSCKRRWIEGGARRQMRTGRVSTFVASLRETPAPMRGHNSEVAAAILGRSEYAIGRD